MFERPPLQLVRSRMNEPRRFIQVLIGASLEVDFVLEKRGQLVGLEVKSGAIQANSGMAAFQKAFSPESVLLIGNTGLPWQEFLQINPATMF